MKKIIPFLIVMFLATSVYGAELNKKYSYQAFPYHGLSFKDRPASEFSNTVIRGTCFYQEYVEGDKDLMKDIFPVGIVGLTFDQCNLDNIKLPQGSVMINCTNKKIKVQNDLSDWELDENEKPLKPIAQSQYEERGLSTDPKDLPKTKLDKPILNTKVKDENNIDPVTR